MLNLLSNLLHPALKVKSRMVAWVPSGSKCVGCQSGLTASYGCHFQHPERVLQYVSLAQEKTKMKNSKYSFY